jgi:hypothetical protein
VMLRVTALVLTVLTAEPYEAQGPEMNPHYESLGPPAPRWPSAIIFGVGALGLTISAGFALAGLSTFGCPTCANDQYLKAGISAAAGLAFMVFGAFWLAWARNPS